jgi:ribosomal protein L16 Arg81 hydroxylase
MLLVVALLSGATDGTATGRRDVGLLQGCGKRLWRFSDRCFDYLSG